MQYIAVKGMDRGGTNVFLSLFHCRPEFFSLTEKVQSTAKRNNIKKIAMANLWKHSMFKGLDVNLKDRKNVRNIIFKMPREADFVGNVYTYKYYEYRYDRMIYLIRNPLRVYVSQMKANVHKKRRQKWDEWTSIINQVATNLKTYNQSRRDEGEIIIYEHFLSNLNSELPKLLTRIDKDAEQDRINPNMGLEFWQHCGVCKSKLQKGKSKYLKCLKCGVTIMGHGGFNPAAPVNYERAMHEDLHAYFVGKPKMIRQAKQKFGESLFDYWYNDRSHNYTNLPEEME